MVSLLSLSKKQNASFDILSVNNSFLSAALLPILLDLSMSILSNISMRNSLSISVSN